MTTPLIATLGLDPKTLAAETMLITGAGGGIGFEAARSLLWLGANVILAEINPVSGPEAAERLAAKFAPERVLFVQTDVGDETGVRVLYRTAVECFGKVDAVVNNATIAALGAVKDLPATG